MLYAIGGIVVLTVAAVVYKIFVDPNKGTEHDKIVEYGPMDKEGDNGRHRG